MGRSRLKPFPTSVKRVRIPQSHSDGTRADATPRKNRQTTPNSTPPTSPFPYVRLSEMRGVNASNHPQSSASPTSTNPTRVIPPNNTPVTTPIVSFIPVPLQPASRVDIANPASLRLRLRRFLRLLSSGASYLYHTF